MNASATGLLEPQHSPANTARRLAERLVQERRRLLPRVAPLISRYAAALARDVTYDHWADQSAQAWACLFDVIRGAPQALRRPRIIRWLIAQADPLWRELLVTAVATVQGQAPRLWRAVPLADLTTDAVTVHPRGSRPPPDDDPCQSITWAYESFLAGYNAGERTRWGVYYTPLELVRYMVAESDRLLREEFGLQRGLADENGLPGSGGRKTNATGAPFLHVLDPAAGSGTFLVEILRHRYQQYLRRPADGRRPKSRHDGWDALVASWMPRLRGYEILLPACAIVQWNIAARLWTTGFGFRHDLPLNVMPHDTLAGPDEGLRSAPGGVRDEGAAEPATLIIGNPPFAGISRNDSAWMAELLRGRWPPDAARRSYFHVDGLPLRERKVWLNDDYVKFFRYAQWRIDQAGPGLIAFVSNHGYLDNATFRGLRHSLLQSFPRITVIDLHGNAKRREKSPDGGRDENVFGIEQGVCVAFLRRTSRPPLVQRADVWGRRSEKLKLLGASADGRSQGPTLFPVAPHSPRYLFSPRRQSQSLPRGPRLTEVMPVNCTAPITARDHFVVAFTREEIAERLRHFQDLSIGDDEIRARYFQRTRSHRYAAGDTRGWKLNDARRRMVAMPDVSQHVTTCLYRPFDERYLIALDWMIDWPRTEVMRHLAIPGNRLLITRRQMLPDQPCNFFWAADRPILDGVIRSDNRGSESLFPVYVHNESGSQANFSHAVVDRLADRTGWAWHAAGRGDRQTTFGPDDVVAYIYGLFHLPWYREAYAELLSADFPPVLIPATAAIFRELASAGDTLLAIHCRPESNAQWERFAPRRIAASQIGTVEPGFPRFRGETVWINAETGFAGIEPEVWNWCAGAHQVCRKWLRDRRGRALGPELLQHYAQIVAAVASTLHVQRRIESHFRGTPGRTLFVDAGDYSG